VTESEDEKECFREIERLEADRKRWSSCVRPSTTKAGKERNITCIRISC